MHGTNTAYLVGILAACLAALHAIVMFAQHHPTENCILFGQIAFFLRRAAHSDEIEIVGGNDGKQCFAADR